MMIAAIAATLLLACSPTEAAIHRHANYTLWPVRMAGRDGPEEELARYQPQRPQPSKPFKPKANPLGATSGDAPRSPAVEAAWARLKRCSEPPPGIRDCTTAEWADVWRGFKDAGIDPNQSSGEGELDDQDATPSGQPPSTATPPSPSTSPWPRRDVTDGAAAALARLDATPHRKLPFDHVPMANSSAAEDGESFSDSVRSLAAVDRRANLSVTKLNLWERFPTTSGDARMQHGHFIRLDNPHRHFSVHEPRGGCKATKEQGGLERTSDNARRNRCRVATNAGFFNVQRPPAGQPFIRHCYNALISRDGRFVQKQHTRLRSQQFTRNVHFGLTSHGHFFIGYLDDQLLRDHVRPGTVVPEDIDDLQLRRDEAAAREKRAAEVAAEIAAAAAARNGGGGGGGSSSSGSRSGVDAATGAKYTLAPVRPADLNKTSSNPTRSPSDPEPDPEDPRWHFSTLIGGVTWLVRDGREYVLDSVLRDGEDMRVEMSECSWAERCGDDPSGFRRSEHFLHLNSARTALGHTADGALVILSIDGVTHDAADPSSMRPGDQEKPGVTLYDMARMLVSFGVVNAINLDGGGSATVVVDGVVSNYPSDAAAMPPWEGSTWTGRQTDLIASSEREVSSITCIYDHDEGDNDVAQGSGGSGSGTGSGAQRGAGAGADDPAAPTPVREIDVHINNATGSVMVFNASTMLNASRAETAAAAAAAAAPADGPSALEQSLRNQLFWFNIAVPLLASFTLLLMLAFAYHCWVTRNAGRSAPLTHSGGFERVGGDAGNMGAAVAVSPRVSVADMFANEEGARETGPWSSKGRRSPRLDQEDSDAAALRLELGGAGHVAAVDAMDAADSDIERPHAHPSSVVEALGVERAVALPLAVTAAAAGNGQSARDFAFRDLDARDDLCIHSPPKEQAPKDADAALDAQTLRLQREAAAHQRQTHKERRKFTSAKHGGQAPAAESLSGLVAGDGVYELGELSDDEQDVEELP